MKLEYDSISPITGNECVLEEGNEQDNTVSFLCMESGYTSFDKLILDSEFQKTYESKLTELMISCRFVAEDKKVWYPSFMQLPGGMLYIEGASKDEWNWKVAKVISLNEEERKQYPIIGKPNEYHTSRLDVENAKQYNNGDFKVALDELYSILKETISNEN